MFFIFFQVTKLILKVASSELDTTQVQEAREVLLDCIETHEFAEAKQTVDLTIKEISTNTDRTTEEAQPDDQPSVNSLEEDEEEDESNDQPKEKSKKKKTDLMSVFIDDLMPPEYKISKTQRLRLSGNRFYLPTFVPKFRQLLRCFPTWTGLMQELFEHHEDVGTSARSETYFGQVKQALVPKGSAPKRLDKFLV